MDLNLSFNSSLIIFSLPLVTQLVRKPPAMQETWVRSLGLEDPLGRRKWQTHSSILVWRIPVDREACWATVYGGHKESDTTELART